MAGEKWRLKDLFAELHNRQFMHYSLENPLEHRHHGMRHNPFKALVAPRPIGWISTVSKAGVLNLGPYSFFNAVCDSPPIMMFSSSGRKDSLNNVEETGEFTCSMSTEALVDAMNLSSALVAANGDEFKLAKLRTAPSLVVKPPRVAASPSALECRLWKTLALPRTDAKQSEHVVVFGHVVAIYIDDAYVKDGIVDTGAMRPLARMGYMDYSVVRPDTVITLNRPIATADKQSASVQPGPWDGVYR
jgi:flavin reductase (DIM6/NTAB) family NADH-FMN oxidoreductase RutF